MNVLIGFVDARYLAKQHSRILLFPQYATAGRAALARRKNGSRHLVEQGLKQVVIRAIDQGDFRWRLLESLGCGQSAKATADYDDSRLSHLPPQFLRSFWSNSDRNTTMQPNRHIETAERKWKRAPEL